MVFKAIRSAGCTPRFIDVDRATCRVSAEDLSSKASTVDAVIAVHTFGHVCDVDQMRDAAPGKPIIEDCAQALGSTLNGRSVGLFGDVAAWSFHSGKYVSVGEGGALLGRCRPAVEALGTRGGASGSRPAGRMPTRRGDVPEVLAAQSPAAGTSVNVCGRHTETESRTPHSRRW